MTATRDPVSRRRHLPVLAVRRALRRGSHRPRRAAEAVKEVARPVARQQHVSVLRRTVSKAWDDRVLGLSAEAAFWQLLSLAPLFLGLLGSIGYLSGFLGATTVDQVEASLLDASRRAFAPSVVDQIIAPTVDEVLRRGRADVVSVGFVLALWAGSSATATFVNTVTIAYGMRDLRGAVQSRLLALGLYLLTVVIGIVLLPVMVIGPGRLLRLFPRSAQGDVQTILQATYWPLVAVLLLVGLVTFYHLAPPRRLPWQRGFPGAVLAGLVFVGGTIALRTYIDFVVESGLTYGALAAPIGALLFFYILALAVLLGAEFNAAIEQAWPTRTRRPRPRRHPEQPATDQPIDGSRPSDQPARSDEPQPARSDEPQPAQSDEPQPAQSDEPQPAQSDEPQPIQTDRPPPNRHPQTQPKTEPQPNQPQTPLQTSPQATQPQDPPQAAPPETKPKIQPHTNQPQAAQPQAAQPRTPPRTQPQAAQPQAAQPQAAQPQAAQPQAAQPQAARPQAAQPQAAQPQAAQPRAHQPQPQTNQPQTAPLTQPQAAQPEGTQPQAAQPQSRTHQPQAVWPQPDQLPRSEPPAAEAG